MSPEVFASFAAIVERRLSGDRALVAIVRTHPNTYLVAAGRK